MKLATKFTLALLLGMIGVLAAFGYSRAQRELSLFESDMRRDHRAMGQALGLAVARFWHEGGEAAALQFVEQASREKEQISIRWVWVDAPTNSLYSPHLPAKQLAPLALGRELSLVDRDPEGQGQVCTYIPVSTGEPRLGALELIESMADERSYVKATLLRVLGTTAATIAVSGLVAMVLGVWLVGRPVRALIEKARRVGEGDLSAPLQLKQRDEFAELALELNAMCDRLAMAQVRIQTETAARIATIEQLRHADRLMTIGKLASGIAHELGTPLNVILARARMVASREVEGQEAADYSRVIAEQCDRMTRIIRQLLDFARPRRPLMEIVDLRKVVRQTLALLQPMADRQCVTFSVVGDENPALAEVDADQIHQVLSNLVMNGIQAMPAGGKLTISLGSRVTGPPVARGAAEGRYLCVEVQDQGSGIAQEDLARIFDPFFTTKGFGEGTGLGLSVSHGIVHEHGGWISATTAIGSGSCFSVYLPEEARR